MAINKLSVTAIRHAKCPANKRAIKMHDGGGLFLLVNATGSKLWRFRYRLEGKSKLLSLGSHPDTDLAQARSKAKEMRDSLMDGVDPSAQRAMVKASQQVNVAAIAASTFKVVAERWLQRQRIKWTVKHDQKVTYWFTHDIYPAIGGMKPDEITAADILPILRKADAAGYHHKARSIKGLALRVFAYAVGEGLVKRNPVADISSRDSLEVKQVINRPAFIKPKDVGGLLRMIDGYSGSVLTRNALLLLAMLFTRPGELRKMEWSEVDLEAAEWRIPAIKMKLRRPHVVPLPTQAVQLLHEVETLGGGSRFVFPSERTADRAMSDNTLNAALRRLGVDTKTEHCAHGFRSTARSLLAEMGWLPAIIERQLAHKSRDATEAAYDRAQYLPERVKMMQQWADYLDGLRDGAQVIPINRAMA